MVSVVHVNVVTSANTPTSILHSTFVYFVCKCIEQKLNSIFCHTCKLLVVIQSTCLTTEEQTHMLSSIVNLHTVCSLEV